MRYKAAQRQSWQRSTGLCSLFATVTAVAQFAVPEPPAAGISHPLNSMNVSASRYQGLIRTTKLAPSRCS